MLPRVIPTSKWQSEGGFKSELLTDLGHTFMRPRTSLHIQVMGDTYHNKAPDVNFPDKEWGYLALEPTCFRFVGPDREPIDMFDTSQYLRAAKIIRKSGLPNYEGLKSQ